MRSNSETGKIVTPPDPVDCGRSNGISSLFCAKIFAGRRISDIPPWFQAQSVITLTHVQPVFALVRRALSPLSWPWESSLGKPCAPPATHRAEAAASTAKPWYLQQALLGSYSASLAGSEAVPHHRHACNAPNSRGDRDASG